MWQAIFFDFDGVILDSVNVKTRAFAKMYSSYGTEVERQVVEYHLAHGGVSRFEKFKYYEALFNKPATEKKLKKLNNDFSALVLNEVLKSPFIEGAIETLEFVRRKKIFSFVVSGTPDEEIKVIVDQRGLSKYFNEVHGSPTHKDILIRDIAKRYGLRLTECLLIGDSVTDYNAAKATGTRFLGIVQNKKQSPFPAGTLIKDQVILFD